MKNVQIEILDNVLHYNIKILYELSKKKKRGNAIENPKTEIFIIYAYYNIYLYHVQSPQKAQRPRYKNKNRTPHTNTITLISTACDTRHRDSTIFYSSIPGMQTTNTPTHGHIIFYIS